MSKLFYYGWTWKNDLVVASNLESIAPVCLKVATTRASTIAHARRLAARSRAMHTSEKDSTRGNA